MMPCSFGRRQELCPISSSNSLIATLNFQLLLPSKSWKKKQWDQVTWSGGGWILNAIFRGVRNEVEKCLGHEGSHAIHHFKSNMAHHHRCRHLNLLFLWFLWLIMGWVAITQQPKVANQSLATNTRFILIIHFQETVYPCEYWRNVPSSGETFSVPHPSRCHCPYETWDRVPSLV